MLNNHPSGVVYAPLFQAAVFLPRAAYARAGLSNRFCPSLSSLLLSSVIKKIEKTV